MLSNNLHIIISGSRESREKDVIIEELKRAGYENATFYDCEDTTTDMDEVSKQLHINRLISQYDWFILIATTNTYGKYTKMEWMALIDSLKGKKRERLVSVIRCANIEESLSAQGIDEKGEHHFSEFEEYQRAAGIPENFYIYYRYDRDFSDLRIKVRDEIQKALSQNQSLRKLSIPRQELIAADVFTNTFRTEEINGYNESIYVWRPSVDAKLEKSSLYTIIVGAPAAGKTRAAYQYMKYSSALSPNARIINVTPSNLRYVKSALTDFEHWVYSNMIKKDDYDEYILFFDEIIETLQNQNNIADYREIVRIASSLHIRIIATALHEDYKHMRSHSIFTSDEEVVTIPYLSEDDEKVREAVRNTFHNTSVVESSAGDIMDSKTLLEDEVTYDVSDLLSDDTEDSTESDNSADNNSQNRKYAKRNHDVIGEYIQGLKDYHHSIKNNINSWLRKPNGETDVEKEQFLKLFIESFTIIRTFRKDHYQMPLGLILMTIDKSGKNALTEDRLNSLLSFLKSNNILEIYDKEANESVTDLWLDYDSTYCYDNEHYHMLVSENLILHTLNDYIWAYLVGTYGLNEYTNVKVTERAMQMFFRAFHEEAPLTTIRRIINRSHSVIFATRYRAQNNHARDFVFPYVLKHAADMELWDNQFEVLNLLVANILHISESVEQLKQDYALMRERSRGRFTLTTESVAEIMGFATNRTEMVKQQIKDFLTENGWDFNRTEESSLYYHQRQIEYSKNFFTALEYIKTHLLNQEGKLKEHLKWESLKDLGEEEGLYKFNIGKLLSSLLKFCRRRVHISQWITLARELGIINKVLLKRLAEVMRTTMMGREENRELVNEIYDLLFDPQLNKLDFDKEITAYYILDMCNCLANSIIMYSMLSDTFADNNDLRVRCESMMLSKMSEDEYGLFIKEFFDHGKLKYNFSNPTRNNLIKQLIIEISMALLPQLFDGKTPDAIADQYTLASLLKINSEFIDRASYKEKVINKNTSHMAFQYLQEIMSMPIFSQMVYHMPIICQMINCTISQKQEDYVFKHYIKPSIRRQIENGSRKYANEEALQAEIEERCTELKKKPQIAIHLIQQRYQTDINKVIKLSLDAIEQMRKYSQGQNLVNASLITITFRKVFDLYTDGYDLSMGENPNFKLKNVEAFKKKFISGVLKVPFAGSKHSLWDQLIKDDYFYHSYFRLYPEIAVEKTDGHYHLSKNLDEIPNDYIGRKLYSNILQGVAAIICDKEGSDAPLHDIEMEIGTRTYDYSWDIFSYNMVKRFYPDYEFYYPIPSKENRKIKVNPKASKESKVEDTQDNKSGSVYNENMHIWQHLKEIAKKLKHKDNNHNVDWDGLLQESEEVVMKNPESMPYLNNVFDIVKSRKMPPLHLLELLRIIYLERGWSIGVTLWKNALDSIKAYKKNYPFEEKKKIGEEIAKLTEEYGHLIQENDITLVQQLNFLRGDAYSKVREKVFSSEYLSHMSMSLLILSPKVFDKDMIKYLDVMYRFMYNSELLYGDDYEITNDFTRFTVEFTKMYTDKSNYNRRKELTQEDYEDISDILYQTLRAKPEKRENLKMYLAPIEDSFYRLLEDIEANTDDDVKPLYALLTGE